ncbi:hypothetical protein EYV94_22290 [Puteibacter caeruleilacunae]|nr:hypothetical protein EYV94_22290 [Puteibacter caeruleilacunae]
MMLNNLNRLRIMLRYIKNGIIGLCLLCGIVSCDDASSFLDQYTENGPIIYAAKVNELAFQSGYYRVRVNIFPSDDVNRDYCMLKWNITNDVKDSVKVEYSEANYDAELECYYKIIDVSEHNIQGNLLIEAQNVDIFGNKSLKTNEGAFIYGLVYQSALLNDGIGFSPDVDEIIIGRKIGSTGNFVSYEKTDGTFTDEVFITDNTFPLVNAKIGGVVRNKTKFHIHETDIDTLVTTKYTETIIPYPPAQIVDYCTEANDDLAAKFAFDGLVNHNSSTNMWHTGWMDPDHQKFHNNNSDPTLAHYYVIDYKDEFTMNSITVYNDVVGFLKTVDVWISNDSEYIANSDKGTDRTVADYWKVPHENTWTKIGTLSFEKASDLSRRLELETPQEFRMVMLTMPDSHNTGNGNIRISEIKVDANRIID